MLTALDKIGYVTDIPLDDKGGNAMLEKETPIKICAKDLVFGFPEERKKIFDGLSFDIAAKEKVVLSLQINEANTFELMASSLSQYFTNTS